MPIPFITESALAAAKSILERDYRIDTVEATRSRFLDVKTKNPVLWDWVQETVQALFPLAIVFDPDWQIPEKIPVDSDRTFISLRLAQNLLMISIAQVYRTIEAQMEANELEGK
jgi:hypothetical protein